VKHKCYQLQRENTEKIDVDIATKNAVTEAMTRWVIEACRPFAIVEDKSFHDVLQSYVNIGVKFGSNVNIKQSIPHSTTIARNINGIFQKCFESVKESMRLAKETGFSLTCDMWSDSFQNKHFLALTAHFVKKGKVIKKLLGFKCMGDERSTG